MSLKWVLLKAKPVRRVYICSRFIMLKLTNAAEISGALLTIKTMRWID